MRPPPNSVYRAAEPVSSPPGPAPKAQAPTQPCPPTPLRGALATPALEPCDAGPASPSYQTSHMFLTH